MANNMKIADGSKLFLNEFDLSGALNTHSRSTTRAVVATRTFAGNDHTASDVLDSDISFGGWAVYGADLYEEETFNLMTNESDQVLGVIYGGAAGDVAYEDIGKLVGRPYTTSVGNVDTIDGSLTGEWFARGLAVDVDRSVTGTGGGTGQNIGAITGTLAVVVRVTAVNTFTSMTVDIEESSDDGSGDAYAKVTGWTWNTDHANVSEASDTLTFTGVGYAVGYKTVAPSEAWIRTNATALTGTSATVSSMAGEAKGIT